MKKNTQSCISKLLFLVGLALLPLSSFAQTNFNQKPKEVEQTLTVMNRDLAVFRASLAGTSPEKRVERAKERFSHIQTAELDSPIKAIPFEITQDKGVQFQLGDRLLFSLIEKDVEPDATGNFDLLVKETITKLEELRDAKLAQLQYPFMFNQVLTVILATATLIILIWIVRVGLGRLSKYLLIKCHQLSKNVGGIRWAEYLTLFGARLVQAFSWFLILGLIYLWLTYSLSRFPFTSPIGSRLGAHIGQTFEWLFDSLANAIPNLMTIVIIVLVTRAINDLLKVFFRRVQTGQLEIPFLHRDTVSASQRIASVILWGIAIAIIYPFIPGSSSDAFKGLSVFMGLVISLGSTGLVNQLMSGLVVIYSRAIRVGDLVSVDGTEGVVTEVGGLATKIQSLQKIEITVPNSVLISNSIQNLSRLNEKSGALFSTKVTIGYDAPWRKVHEMLIDSAQKISDIRHDPKPVVYQRGLSDFYVEYELFMHLTDPSRKVAILSLLHQEIQDAFNANGIQIMSPHFMAQPTQPVIAPTTSNEG
jgi:small-conductance mechanosensitive channel